MRTNLNKILNDTNGHITWRTSGLWLDRLLVEAGGNHSIIELPLPSGPYNPAVAWVPRIKALLHALSEEMLEWFCLPSLNLLSSDYVFVYTTKVSTTVFEILNGSERQAWDIPFSLIGERLALLHETDLDETAKTAFPRGRPPIALAAQVLSGFPNDQRLHTLYRCLHGCEEFRTLACEAEDQIENCPQVLLHGRWSSGVLLFSADEKKDMVILGGIDCWLGPAEFDLGYLMGELLEFATDSVLSGREPLALFALEASRALLAGYHRHRKDQVAHVIRFAAHRVLSHLVANTWWRYRQGYSLPSVREIISLFTVSRSLLSQLK